MEARILDGKAIAAQVVAELAEEIEGQKSASRPPGLAAVLVGDDPASQVYVRNKLKTCRRCGIESQLVRLPENTTQQAVDDVLQDLERDSAVDGILLQLPLPRHFDSKALLQSLPPSKDVDGLHPLNLGKLAADDADAFVPCTPAGILQILKRSDISVEGKRVVVVGRSQLVGKPVALLLMGRGDTANATVTVVHTKSRDVPKLIGEAEILIAAAGSAGFVKGEWLRPGVVVIDVGIHRVPPASGETKGHLVGDVDFESARQVAAAITPVPGGVGPMTVAMLMSNTVRAWQRHIRG